MRFGASPPILRGMTRAIKRPKPFRKPANWTTTPPPKPQSVVNDEELSPTRYGDWTIKGVAVDF